MITPALKNDIRACYKNLQQHLPDFVSRKAQSELIVELTKTLSGEYDASRRILVAEAGTGIGKSIAYLMSAILYALHNDKKVVISTATVALQEQLIKKDLPLFTEISPQPFSFALAKGRNRYCCIGKLTASIDLEDIGQTSLFNDEKPKDHKRNASLLAKLYKDLTKGVWDGDIDSWHTPIPEDVWKNICSDKHICNTKLHEHRQCPFAKARLKLLSAHVIVVNHSLLMADIELGGGVILPEPEKTIYILDEGHHFPSIARNFSAASASLIGTTLWLDNLNKNAKKLAIAADIKVSQRFLDALLDEVQKLIPALKQMNKHLHAFNLDEKKIHRFAHGVLPEFMMIEGKSIHISCKKALVCLEKIHELLQDGANEKKFPPHQASTLLSESGFFLQRLEQIEKVWAFMSMPNPDKGAPFARWIETSPKRSNDHVINISPLEVGWRLERQLWSKAAGVGIVSATLRAVNSFAFFSHHIGLSEHDGSRFLCFPSPFNYQQNARLVIPNIGVDPQSPAFTEQLPQIIFEYIEGETATLVLFSSYWQMREVADKMRAKIKQLGWHLHVQGENSRGNLLQNHQNCCIEGKVSILFGTGSFSEGLDLPGNLLTNLIITKIPFAVPTSPIEEAYSEYIEQDGGNPFIQISVPDASKKLIQAVGRLIRKEKDTGRVVLLDRRIITKPYGKALLNALPPFTLVIDSAF